MPKMTDKFETTQVLENGTLEVSCEAEGYLIKDEAVCTAKETGTIEYKVEEGTVVKKESSITHIEAGEADKEKDEESDIKGKYQKILDQLKGYDLLVETNKAPISGVFSMSVDGNEQFFRIGNIDKITKEKADERDLDQTDLEREKVNKGEPIFKISSDDAWYIVTWVEKEDAAKFEEGQKVRITIDEHTMDAKVQTIKKEGEFFKMVFYLNVYYEDFTSARKVKATVVATL